MPTKNDSVHVPEEVIEKAEDLDLRYIKESDKGITRTGSKTRFVYKDEHGKIIRDKNTLKRIKELVIPPAWKDVWISPRTNTHLQATGIDQKGRKQYVYHKEWERLCQEAKFDRVEFFGKHLPLIREALEKDMTQRGLTERRILATIVWLLEHTFIRIGNEEYAKENQSFGLTTLRNKHVDLEGDRVRFAFTGKSGIEHEQEITNPIVVRTIRKCIELPGYEVFQYLDEEKNKRTVDAADVNQYLQEITGEKITAKDFRTWGGTIISAQTLVQIGEPESKTCLKENISNTCKVVSKRLGNTATVCRNYYIHPSIFKTYEKNILIPHIATYKKRKNTQDLKPTEFAVIELLRQYP